MPEPADRPPRGARSTWTGLVALGAVLGLLCVGPLGSVPVAATPWSGGEPTPTNLLFYLHNASRGVAVGAVQYLDLLSTVNDSLAPWNGTGSMAVGSHYDSATFVVAPQLAGALQLNGTIEASVYLNESGSAPAGGSITLAVSSVGPTGGLTLLGTGPANSAAPLGPGGSVPKLVVLTGPTLDRTVAAGDSLAVNITISGNTAEAYGIWWGEVAGTTYASTVTIPASTYLTVPSVTVRSATGAAVTDLPLTKGNATVSVQVDVMDPLGAYDFERFPVDFRVVDRASGLVVFGPVPMTALPGPAPPPALNGTYAASFNYSALAPGGYNFTATATDNTDQTLGSAATLPAYFGRVAIGVAPVTVGLPPVPFRVTVVDDQGQPLRGATVLVRASGSLVSQNGTDSTGTSGFELSNATEFDFGAEWQGVPVGSVSAIVSGPGQDLVLHAAVGDPLFHFETPSLQPLPYALVSIVHPNGSVLPLRVTNASGELALEQAPDGNYTVTAIYDDAVVVLARSVAVSGDGPFVVVAGQVFTLTISTTGSGGSALPGVFVQVINTTTGATVASGVTGSSGGLEFLVPAGSYRVLGSWSATYALTSLAQSEATNISVTGPGSSVKLAFSQAYPPFTSTNEFYLLVGYGVLAALVVLLGLLLLRRRSRGVMGPRREPTQGDGDRTRPPAEP
jgi:hypothetical protein